MTAITINPALDLSTLSSEEMNDYISNLKELRAYPGEMNRADVIAELKRVREFLDAPALAVLATGTETRFADLRVGDRIIARDREDFPQVQTITEIDGLTIHHDGPLQTMEAFDADTVYLRVNPA